jgi:RNA polymerase sigma factor (sigma-70 family)
LSAQKAARAHFRVTGERTEFPSVTCSLDQPLPDSEDCLADRLISSDPSPDDVATLRAEHERLYGALARLPRCEREVIALRFGLVASPELTVRQTARALGVSNSTVSTRSRRALARLRILLTDPTECPSCAPGSPASGGEAEMVPAAREAVACGR